MTAKKSNYDWIKNHWWLVGPFGAVAIFIFNLYIENHDMKKTVVKLQETIKVIPDFKLIEYRLGQVEKRLRIKRNSRKERIIYIRNGFTPERKKKAK